jgi:hypothetical protein
VHLFVAQRVEHHATHRLDMAGCGILEQPLTLSGKGREQIAAVCWILAAVDVANPLKTIHGVGETATRDPQAFSELGHAE